MTEHKPSTRDHLSFSIGSYRDSAVRHVSDALRGGTDHDVHGNRPASLKQGGINLDAGHLKLEGNGPLDLRRLYGSKIKLCNVIVVSVVVCQKQLFRQPLRP